ncbi:hypothetical protein EDD11_003320 [Mortierella claussenii]|nr:hypothetical protein EDD11_003320 [Mortierella claussenii]
MSSQATNPLGDRERAAEDLYIHQREAAKAAEAKAKAQQEAAAANKAPSAGDKK